MRSYRRARIRAAVVRALNGPSGSAGPWRDGVPIAGPDAADAPPFVVVSTPEESPAEEDGGYVAGPAALAVSVAVAAVAATEDGVDALLAEVEPRIAADTTLAGTVDSLDYAGFVLDVDEDATVGVATWTARIETEEV